MSTCTDDCVLTVPRPLLPSCIDCSVSPGPPFSWPFRLKCNKQWCSNNQIIMCFNINHFCDYRLHSVDKKIDTHETDGSTQTAKIFHETAFFFGSQNTPPDGFFSCSSSYLKKIIETKKARQSKEITPAIIKKRTLVTASVAKVGIQGDD